MFSGSRSLPDRPSLRYLKIEAKRRLAAGEFATLNDAQAAIAREHGLPSWTALKQALELAWGGPERESHALAQLNWVIARFRDAGEPGWTAPGDAELREHFHDRFLAVIPAETLVASITPMAAELRGEFGVLSQAPLHAAVQQSGMRYIAAADADPPYRLIYLQGFPTGERITDPRVTAPPPARSQGAPPPLAAGIADDAVAELGLAALVLAGGEPGRPPWVIAKGHADLDRAEVLEPGHRFPAPGVTALVTATATLGLVAAGRLGLDAPANEQLRTVRLADDAITVRQLLSHSGGVDEPAGLYGDAVPDLKDLMGAVVSCSGPRGTATPGNGGYAVLGQLIADVTGMPYAEAATRLVLEPLRMHGSWFPTRAADITPGKAAVTGYTVTAAGAFVPFPVKVCTVQAVAGLWSTGADLVRLATGWSSLLSKALAREALTPQAGPAPDGYHFGLGWLISPEGDSVAHGGASADAVALLRVRTRDNRAHVALTNRALSLDSIDDRLSRS